MTAETKSLPTVKTISRAAPWNWLQAGWQDMWQDPTSSLMYGAIFTAASLILFFGLFELEMTALMMVLAGGFMLLGPMFAVGLYAKSRAQEKDEAISFSNMLFVKTRAPMQLAYMGLLLSLIYTAWVRFASLLYALFFGMSDFPPLEDFLPTLLFSPEGAWMLAIGTIFGGMIAFAVFAVSAISVPLLYHRDIDFMSAVLTSLNAIRINIRPMIVWAWLIALFTVFGMASLTLGMVIVFPLVGHATWHAYRDIVE